LRIDLLIGIDGVDFDAAWPLRMACPYDSLSINFIGIDALKSNKRASGRESNGPGSIYSDRMSAAQVVAPKPDTAHQPAAPRPVHLQRFRGRATFGFR
jgi:hypothetical protein